MTGYTSRRLGRRICLEVLYEAEIKGCSPQTAMEERGRLGAVEGEPSQPGLDDEDAAAYARSLLEGIQLHLSEIDALITEGADRWRIERMPIIDRNLARMAIFELLWRDDIPTAVSINEAVELAKSMSTDDSGRFLNGLLGQIADSPPEADAGARGQTSRS